MKWEWVCVEPGCDFGTNDGGTAREHERDTGHMLVHNWDRDHSGPSGWWYVPERDENDTN